MNLKKISKTDRYGNSFTLELYEPPEGGVPEMPSVSMIAIPEMDSGMGMDSANMNSHPGGPKGTDTVPAWLTPGENVVNAEASRIPGNQQMIDQMNQEGREIQEMQGGPIPSMEGVNDVPSMEEPMYAADGNYISNPFLSDAVILNAYDKYLSQFKEPPVGMPHMDMPFDEFKQMIESKNAIIKFNQGGQVPTYASDGMNFRDWIKSKEGVENNAYQDVAGNWTIGAGNTDNVQPNQSLSNEEVESRLSKDIANVNQDYGRLVTNKDLNNNQQMAVKSLMFNIGPTQFGSSKALQALNAGDYPTFLKEAKEFRMAGGKVVKGLVNRRESEFGPDGLFNKPVPETSYASNWSMPSFIGSAQANTTGGAFTYGKPEGEEDFRDNRPYLSWDYQWDNPSWWNFPMGILKSGYMVGQDLYDIGSGNVPRNIFPDYYNKNQREDKNVVNASSTDTNNEPTLPLDWSGNDPVSNNRAAQLRGLPGGPTAGSAIDHMIGGKRVSQDVYSDGYGYWTDSEEGEYNPKFKEEFGYKLDDKGKLIPPTAIDSELFKAKYDVEVENTANLAEHKEGVKRIAEVIKGKTKESKIKDSEINNKNTSNKTDKFVNQNPTIWENVKEEMAKFFPMREIVRAGLSYVGSRLLGYNHADSIEYVGKDYLKRVDADMAAKEKWARSKAALDNFEAGSIANFLKTLDYDDLIPKGGRITGIDSSNIWWDEDTQEIVTGILGANDKLIGWRVKDPITNTYKMYPLNKNITSGRIVKHKKELHDSDYLEKKWFNNADAYRKAANNKIYETKDKINEANSRQLVNRISAKYAELLKDRRLNSRQKQDLDSLLDTAMVDYYKDLGKWRSTRKGKEPDPFAIDKYIDNAFVRFTSRDAIGQGDFMWLDGDLKKKMPNDKQAEMIELIYNKVGAVAEGKSRADNLKIMMNEFRRRWANYEQAIRKGEVKDSGLLYFANSKVEGYAPFMWWIKKFFEGSPGKDQQVTDAHTIWENYK